MLQLIKNNSPFTVIILFIFTLFAKMQFLLHPELPIVTESNEIFGLVVKLLDVLLFKSAFAYTLLTVILLFGQAIFLNAVANKHKLYAKQTYVVAFLYICLSSLYAPFNYFSEVLLANWFLIAAMNIILNIHQSNKPRTSIFNIGFLLSVAFVLHFPALVLFCIVFISVSLLRRFNISEWVVGFVGYLIPLYFLVSLLYLFSTLEAIPAWLCFGFSLPTGISNPLYIIGLVAGVIILISTGVYALQKQISRASIFVRRGWTVLAAIMFFSSITAVFTSYNVKSTWLITLPALTLVIAPALYSEKNKLFSNFVFYFSLLLIVFCQLTVDF